MTAIFIALIVIILAAMLTRKPQSHNLHEIDWCDIKKSKISKLDDVVATKYTFYDVRQPEIKIIILYSETGKITFVDQFNKISSLPVSDFVLRYAPLI